MVESRKKKYNSFYGSCLNNHSETCIGALIRAFTRAIINNSPDQISSQISGQTSVRIWISNIHLKRQFGRHESSYQSFHYTLELLVELPIKPSDQTVSLTNLLTVFDDSLVCSPLFRHDLKFGAVVSSIPKLGPI